MQAKTPSGQPGEFVDVRVSYNGGTYTTATVRGVRASATSSAEDAARRFGHKLFGSRLRQVSHIERSNASTDYFRIWATAS
mgnify:CR=1 FL=1